MKPRWGAAALALLLAASAAAQQGEGGSGDPATQIRPDASPALSLGTRVSQSGNVHLIDGGTRAGANLFHSFARFDLGRGDVAPSLRPISLSFVPSEILSRLPIGSALNTEIRFLR